MELPKHTCISCAYLYGIGGYIIPHLHREWALDDKKWNYGLINYQRLVCDMGKLESFESGIAPMDIRNQIKNQGVCKHWKNFSGILPAAIEQRESSKWAKRISLITLTVMLITLAVILITWILSQFVLK